MTQKLINLVNILDHCDEVTFTRVTISSGRMPYFIEEAFDSLDTAHLNLGNGNNRRHVHITYDVSSDLKASPSADLLVHSLGSNMVGITI